MSKQPTEDITKLPAWAQRKIRKLENELQSRTEELKALTTGEGSIYYGHYYAHDGSKRRAIPEHETVRFVIDAERLQYIEIHRNARGAIVVSAGSNLLVIRPIANNCAVVGSE